MRSGNILFRTGLLDDWQRTTNNNCKLDHQNSPDSEFDQREIFITVSMYHWHFG